MGGDSGLAVPGGNSAGATIPPTDKYAREGTGLLRGILFDKDGTLLDFEASWTGAYRRLSLDLAHGDAARADRMLAEGGFDAQSGQYRAGSALAAGTAADIARLWFPALAGPALTAMTARIDRAFYENAVLHSVPVAGAAETLAALAGLGLVMGVATSDGTEAAVAAIAALGFAERLPYVLGYDAVAAGKPAPDLVHAFCAATGLAPGDVAVVGDNTHDLAMARSAGAGWAVGVLSGTGSADDLAPLADVVLAGIGDLPAWVRQVGASATRG
jgi:phosphoglycolate phosphatase